MRNFYSRKYFLIISLLFLIPGALNAAGTIKGVVKDAQTGEGLPGANVFIRSISHGTITDLSGGFTLAAVPGGTHTVTISYMGYEEQEVTVSISDGGTQILEISLNLLAIQGEEVVITAQAFGQRAAINQQLAANTVVNVVSSEKIEELPDANAAEAIGRLPGISLKRNGGEANRIVIRGLSPRYNNVTVEGIKMASTSDFDRSVDLSLIQSESLAAIEVSKTLRPDMDADALGGTVNLRLQEAPDIRKINLTAEGGYANINSDLSNYKISGGISDRFFNKQLGLSLKVSHELKQLPSHEFRGEYSDNFWSQTLDSEGNVIDSSLYRNTNSAILTEKHISRYRTNGALILDYKTDWWEGKFFNLLSIMDDDVTTRNNEYRFNSTNNVEQYYQQNNLAEWRNLTRTHTFQNTFRFGASKLNVDVSTTYAEVKMEDQTFPFLDITNTQGRININNLKNAQPTMLMNLFGGPDSLNIDKTYLQRLQLGDRLLTDQSYDARIDYELQYTLWGSMSGALKLGGKYHRLTRTSDGTGQFASFQWGGGDANRNSFINMIPESALDANAVFGIPAVYFVDDNYHPGEFLNGRYGLGWGADLDYLSEIQGQYYPDGGFYTVAGQDSYIRDYETTEELYAAYIMTELNIGPKLMILPGIRFEDMNTEYFAYHVATNANLTGIDSNPDSLTVGRQNSHWFPSVNLKFKPVTWINVQGAVYKSTTRPSFRQISPYVQYSTTSNYFISNNPFLEPAQAWNFDLGVSFAKPKVGLFTVYGFFKVIDDLIFNMGNYQPAKDTLIVDGPDDINDKLLPPGYYDDGKLRLASRTSLPINNPEQSYVSGIEVSWQTNFWYLPGALKGLVLDVNWTLLNTRTSYPYFEDVVVDVDSSFFIPIETYGLRYRTREAKMADQPASILNIILGWDYKGFSGRVSYRFQSKTTLTVDARHEIQDTYYDDFSLIDVMIKQRITENISVYANLTNIGNHVDDYYWSQYGSESKMPMRAEFYGFRAQVGLKIGF